MFEKDKIKLEAMDIFLKKTALAWDECNKTKDSADAEYRKVHDSAYKVFRESLATAKKKAGK